MIFPCLDESTRTLDDLLVLINKLGNPGRSSYPTGVFPGKELQYNRKVNR